MRTLLRVIPFLLLASIPCVGFADSLSGTVKYSDGTPVGGAVVYALNGTRPLVVRNNTVMVGERVPRALSDRNGAFQLNVDPSNLTGLFAQDMEDACGVAAINGVDQPVSVTIEGPAQGDVRVLQGPNPASKENLLLTKEVTIPGLRFTYAGTTNADGMYRLPPLTPGSYTVCTWEDVPQVGCCFRSVVTRMTQVDLAPGSRREITLGGTDLPVVTGKIVSTDGEPLHGVWVRLIPKGTAPTGAGGSVVHSAVTERDGSYSVYDVPPGDYEVRCFRRLALNDSSRTFEAISDLRVADTGDTHVTCDVSVDTAPFLPLEPGQPAPAVGETTLDGQSFRLSDLKGQYVVLHFYAGWCRPCVQTIGYFDHLTTELGGSAKVKVVGISLDESEAEARAFVQEKGIAHPVIYAGSWAENPVRKAYRVVNIPTTVIVDPDGTIAQIDLHGQVLLDFLRKQLASAS